MSMMGCRELPAQVPHYLGGSTVQGSWSLCAALASWACSAIFGISSAPLVGMAGATVVAPVNPDQVSPGGAGQPWSQQQLCRMTRHSAFSHPLPPLPLCSPELQRGLRWCPQEPAPPQQLHGHPQICPAGILHHPTATLPSLPWSAQHWGPYPYCPLQRHLHSPVPP